MTHVQVAQQEAKVDFKQIRHLEKSAYGEGFKMNQKLLNLTLKTDMPLRGESKI